MVKPFNFSRIPEIIFRENGSSELPGMIRRFGSRVIILTGNQSFLSTHTASSLLNDLEALGIGFRLFKIPGEPTPEMIDGIVSDLREDKPDLVVAIGGGSVMDAGKAVSAMVTVDDSIINYLEGIGKGEHPGTKVPFIAVPTTSGTGSEATKNSVISRVGEGGFKRSLRHDNFVPDIALVDPVLTYNCPKNITAAGGMDCFTQLTEAYLSDKASEYTDVLALAGIEAVRRSLVRCFDEGNDPVARTDMSFAALTSGICLANAGLGVVHGFASSIGGLYEIPHGVICGTLMAYVNEVNVRKLRSSGSNPVALEKYAKLGRMFTGDDNKSDEYVTDAFISYLHEMTDKLHLPGLKSAGMEESSIEKICAATGNKNNPVTLDKNDLAEIISKRLI